MRKILGISASRREWGNCETAVKQVLQSAAEEGARTDFIGLGTLHVHPCKGCFRCIGEKGVCPLGDDLYMFLDRVEAADDIVLASPVHFMSAPSTLLALTGRLLAADARMAKKEQPGRAVTCTLMGNREWRGVAEPFVNLTAGLLGFDVVESLALVAEGPGEVLCLDGAVERLADIGRALARGDRLGEAPPGRFCPVCRSDFFRLEPPALVCPVCGLRGDLEAYITRGIFRATGDVPRWGRGWLEKHKDAWIRPSIRRYAAARKEVLKKRRALKEAYRGIEERGFQDVQ
jgi:hypothetical protein